MSGRDALSPVEAALVRACLPGPAATLRSIKSTDWQSLTFKGQRIVIEFDLPNADCRKRAFRAQATLPEIEFALPGAILADGAATVRGDVLSIECLVVED